MTLATGRYHPLILTIYVVVGGLVVMGIGFYFLLIGILEPRIVALLIGTIILLTGAYGLISAVLYRLTVTDEFVEERSIRTVRIEFRDVTGVDLRWRAIVISAGRRKITTAGELKDREHILTVIASQIRPLSGVKITGDKERVRKLFGQ